MKIISYLKDKENLKAGLLSVLKKSWGKTWLAVNQFIDKNLFQYAGALAFNTVLAIVPLVALFFAISRGFGYAGIIETTIRQLLSSQPDAANYIIQFANSYLSNARSSAIIGFGVLVMLYSVIGLINNIETVFNIIWNVKKTRSISRRVMSYLSMFFLVPVTIVIVSGIHLAVSRFIGSSSAFAFLAPLLQLLIRLIPIIVITLVFTMVYKHVPNTRVRFKHAIGPALLAAIFMELLQRAYVYGQVLLSSYNAIYGSLAALPLFMLWVQFSWYIVLFFALLTHTSQDYDFYSLCNGREDFSYNDRTLLSAALLSLICRSFRDGKEHYTASMLKRETGIPSRLVTEMLNDLCAVKVLEERNDPDQKEPTYAPYEDIDNITVGKMLEKLNAHGKAYDHIGILNRINPQAMERINRIWSTYISGMNEVKISDLWNLADDKTSAEAQQKTNA
jgi:membrane protein